MSAEFNLVTGQFGELRCGTETCVDVKNSTNLVFQINFQAVFHTMAYKCHKLENTFQCPQQTSKLTTILDIY